MHFAGDFIVYCSMQDARDFLTAYILSTTMPCQFESVGCAKHVHAIVYCGTQDAGDFLTAYIPSSTVHCQNNVSCLNL